MENETFMEIKQKGSKDKTITLFDRIDARSAEQLVKRIMEFNTDDENNYKELKAMADECGLTIGEPKNSPISLVLSTQGGSCYDGMSIYDAISSSKTPVEITCTGKVMSMGVIVTLAAHVRKAYRNTTFMIHQVASGAIGTLEEMEESIEETRRINDLLFTIIESKTSITREMLEDISVKKRDWFITASEALELGIITEII